MLRTPIARTGTLQSKLRERKCSNCGTGFMQQRLQQQVCSAPCATSFARRLREQQERKDLRAHKAAARADRAATKAALEKFKRKPKWIAEVQELFNKIVRIEDRDLPCISCGKHVVDDGRPGGVWDAGHYLARGGSPHLRFDRRNVHKQCKGCNRPGGTTRAAFREGMIERIGLAAVEALESDQAPRHYSIDDLKAIKAEYAAKLKQLKKEAA